MIYNYKLTISFLGKNYNGWQRQKNGVGVQQVIEERLERLFNQKITVIGCCRTDAGVHALKHVSNFKTVKEVDLSNIKKFLNATLPRDISVLDIEKVDESFHARFDAKGKTYIYRVYTKPDPFLFGRGWYFDKKFDLVKILEGIEILKKHKNLVSIAKKGEYLREEIDLRELKIRFNGTVLEFEITASHFLRGLVRGIVGHLMAIGRGSLDLKEFDKILTSKDPAKGRFSAPAEGLFLKEVYFYY
ncbi:MAG: tRNA pseudouridine(38-40) synthase TruA [Hydrogenothermaceae bacterium]